ncbi:hypothetical protein CYMTET_9826 [Cymbomonas tetramitiformis]|uniref:Uncharacterized protein n=1 Tax=Cymbomonas tetramitiformis TaxID=36881 RepID=A0AAE0GQR5_9CHLO|nr:hypothetical protein CYMTET_9826 [Cymbomonas tetramitiformis]
MHSVVFMAILRVEMRWSRVHEWMFVLFACALLASFAACQSIRTSVHGVHGRTRVSRDYSAPSLPNATLRANQKFLADYRRLYNYRRNRLRVRPAVSPRTVAKYIRMRAETVPKHTVVEGYPFRFLLFKHAHTEAAWAADVLGNQSNAYWVSDSVHKCAKRHGMVSSFDVEGYMRDYLVRPLCSNVTSYVCQISSRSLRPRDSSSKRHVGRKLLRRGPRSKGVCRKPRQSYNGPPPEDLVVGIFVDVHHNPCLQPAQWQRLVQTNISADYPRVVHYVRTDVVAMALEAFRDRERRLRCGVQLNTTAPMDRDCLLALPSRLTVPPQTLVAMAYGFTLQQARLQTTLERLAGAVNMTVHVLQYEALRLDRVAEMERLYRWAGLARFHFSDEEMTWENLKGRTAGSTMAGTPLSIIQNPPWIDYTKVIANFQEVHDAMQRHQCLRRQFIAKGEPQVFEECPVPEDAPTCESLEVNEEDRCPEITEFCPNLSL